jgi:tetratricopeptide (TPR) repeat protein
MLVGADMNDTVSKPVCRACGALNAEFNVRCSACGAAALDDHAAPAPLARGATVGRFVVEGPIGRGGMGVVYAARDPELGRQVAIKLLHVRGESLLGEAQAMARLAHPNVVVVYDVGRVEDQLFVAMELVAGASLASWLAERPRPWREVLEVFIQAGRGLAAAHAAGIAHRDFKPANVLVGRDGRARVGDFGLAALAAYGADEPGRTVAGTPGYMAPEVLAGRSPGAASDQFSFCVALYEALAGAPPFRAESLDALRQQIQRGAATAPLAGRGVPPGVRRALVRGLGARPEDRFATMELLLAALARRPRAVRAAVAVAVAVAVVLGVWGARPARCGGAEAALGDVWSRTRREALARAFAGQPPEAWARVDAGLDDFAARWTAAHTRSCRAARIDGHESEQVLDRRMRCLAQQRNVVAALEGIWLGGEVELLARAREAVVALPLPGACNGDALLGGPHAQAPPPEKSAASVAELRTELAEAKARLIAGDVAHAVEQTRKLVDAAKVLEYAPLEAEALALLGSAEDAHGELQAAEASDREALLAAAAGDDEMTLARATAHLVWVVGIQEVHSDEGRRLAKKALAIADRLGDEETSAEIAYYVGVIGGPHAKEDLLAVIPRFVKLYGAESRRVANTHTALGVYFNALERYTEARDHLEASRSILEKLYGSGHPALGPPLSDLAVVYGDGLADYPAARAAAAQARVVYQAAQGDAGYGVAAADVSLAELDALEGNLAAAETRARSALAAVERALGPVHSRVASAQFALGEVLLAAGDPGAAATAFARSAETRRRTQPPEDMRAARSDCWTAMARMRAGEPGLELLRQAVAYIEAHSKPDSIHRRKILPWQCIGLSDGGARAEAEPICRRAIDTAESSKGPEHPDAIELRIVMARSAPPEAAVPALERAIAQLARRGDSPLLMALARLELARVLASLDPRRAAPQAQAALALYRATGYRDRRALDELERLSR